jgi:hypothetical protein
MGDKQEMQALIAEAMTILNTATSSLGALMARMEVKEEPARQEAKPLTLVEVRAVLADKSRSGFTEQIRELLEKYGAPKLSEIDPSRYQNLMDEALCLGATRQDLEAALAEKREEGLGDLFDAVFGHHYATTLEDLKEEYYPSFLRDIRRLRRAD